MIEIKPRNWDSQYFHRNMGEMIIKGNITEKDLTNALRQAESKSYHHLIARLPGEHLDWAQLLAKQGFYLTDVGVTLSTTVEDVKEPLFPLRRAQSRDIPVLKNMSQGLYLTSRFYNDPFFTFKDADSLFEAWVENSVKGMAADLVLVSEYQGEITGYVTLSLDKVGIIVLIGAKKGAPRGTGSALMVGAHRTYLEKGIKRAEVRTQIYNYPALRLYHKWGYRVISSDQTWCTILG